MKHILENAKKNNEMLCVYFDKEDTESFSAGYVQQVSDEFVMLASVSPTGKYDGYAVRYLDDILLIEEKNKYVEKINYLFHLQDTKHASIPCPAGDGDLLLALLNFCKETKFICQISLVDSGYTDIQGLVTNVEQEHITIQRINNDGASDGIAHCDKRDISKITCDDDDSQMINLLLQRKMTQHGTWRNIT